MGRRLTFLARGISAILGVVAALAATGHLVFRRTVSREVSALLAGTRGSSAVIISEDDLARLPQPVARWLRYTGVVGTARPAIIRLRQEGRFRQSPGAAWQPFRAEQTYTTDPPGFVWAASVWLARVVPIAVLDRYVAGQGGSGASLFGLLSLGSARGPQIDAASLQRYLNETMWFPAAALSPAVIWEAVGADAARATIRNGGLSVSSTFSFDNEGRLLTMTAGRYRSVGKELVLTPWATPIREYGTLAGLQLPVSGEGVWTLESGDFSYIELRVTEVTYDTPLR